MMINLGLWVKAPNDDRWDRKNSVSIYNENDPIELDVKLQELLDSFQTFNKPGYRAVIMDYNPTFPPTQSFLDKLWEKMYAPSNDKKEFHGSNNIAVNPDGFSTNIYMN